MMSDNQSRILIVDDNVSNCDILARRLERRGYATVSVYAGEQALELLETQRFDVMLLDIMMPVVSGIDVLERTRKRYSRAELPIIMATAKDASEDIVQALDMGANDYVTKPIDFMVMLARLETQLELKRASDENRALVAQLKARNDFIQNAFGRYLDDDIVEEILSSPEKLKPGGELQNLTILFADLRGFTRIAESLAPTDVVRLVNNFFGEMTGIIMAHQGTINEFYGDGILAFFGAPIASDDHPVTAVRCALKMQEAMTEVNRLNRRSGLPEVHMGIGINSGDVVVGNIGSEHRIKYGIVGSAVNLAARIEGYAEGGKVLVSQHTLSLSGMSFDASDERVVSAKGIEEPVKVFEISGIVGGECCG